MKDITDNSATATAATTKTIRTDHTHTYITLTIEALALVHLLAFWQLGLSLSHLLWQTNVSLCQCRFQSGTACVPHLVGVVSAAM